MNLFIKTCATLILFLMSFTIHAQNEVQYQDMYLASSDEVGDGKWYFEVFSLGKVKILNGMGNYSKHLFIEDINTQQVIFELKDDITKTSRFEPKFFKANDALPILVLVDLKTTYSWGQHIFIIDGEKVYYSGFLPYSANNFNFSNIALYTYVDYHDNYFTLSFRDDIEFIDYATDELINGADLMFKVEKGKITRI